MTKIIKLTPEPLTDSQLDIIKQWEGDFKENLKLVEETRNNHFVLEK